MVVILIMTCFGLLLSSCCNSDNPSVPEPAAGIPFTATISVIDKYATTRAAFAEDADGVKVSWEEGDKLALVHNGQIDEVIVGKVMADGSATVSGTLAQAAGGEAFKIVYPFDMVTSASDGTNYSPNLDKFLNQDGTLAYIINNVNYCEGEGAMTVSGGKASADSMLKLNSKVVISKFTLTDGSKAISPSSIILSHGMSVNPIVIPESTYKTNGEGVIYLSMLFFQPRPMQLTATVGSDTYVFRESTVTKCSAGDFLAQTIAMAKVEAVQLWSDGPKWASVNVGAMMPEGSGRYFAWGAVTDNFSSKSAYSWNQTPYFSGTDNDHTWLKYQNSGDNLDASDDAARANWGGAWRIPTQQEYLDLTNQEKVTATWTADYNGTGVSGLVFAGATEGFTGNSIFMPAEGIAMAAEVKGCGEGGGYWSATIGEDADHPVSMNFRMQGASVYYHLRYFGCCVRAVQ